MNPVPGPPRPAAPAGPADRPGPTAGAEAGSVDPLDEARQRLEALDERPLHDHPGEFAAIDGLLRRALDGAGSGR